MCCCSYQTFSFYCLFHLSRSLCQHKIAQAQAMYDTCCRIIHIKHTAYFNTHSFHQNTSQRLKNINVYQQHNCISSHITCRTCLSNTRQSGTSINSSVASKCLRSTQYYHRHLSSISGEFQLYFQVRYLSSSSK
jgi:hypothetical protein